MQKALTELKKHNYDLTNLVSNYKKGKETKLNNDTLIYKNIPEALMFLINYKHNNEIQFDNKLNTFGTMIDVSRGAVFKVDYVKNLIRKHALMGINELWIYMEDIYQVDKYPVFGYMRGSYSISEIEEIVSYAEIFNIEVIPAIQTLGHMEQFLRWLGQTAKYKDQANVLLARDENTKNLIYEMLKTIKIMFKTTKIHIGLDETWGFGFGNFYKKNGYIPQIDIFLEHLNIVNDMALEIGFKDVLVWSDMFFRFFSSKNSYYDTNIKFDESIVKQIPNNVNLVYWDYYNKDYNLVNQMLKNHQEITKNLTFASGTWIWSRLTYDKAKTDSYMDTHIKAAKDNNVDSFILTQWMDDGAYGDHETTILGVFEASHKALTNNSTINYNVYKEIQNEDVKDSNLRSLIHQTKMAQVGLLWDDPLFSVYLNSFTNNKLENFQPLLDELKELKSKYKNNSKFKYEYLIISINYHKILGRMKMLEGYKNGKIEVEDIYTKIINDLELLIDLYRDRWYKNYKMYGLEIIHSRLYLQLVRAKEMIIISEKFNNKEIKTIDGLLDKVAIYNEHLYEKHSLIAYTTKPH